MDRVAYSQDWSSTRQLYVSVILGSVRCIVFLDWGGGDIAKEALALQGLPAAADSSVVGGRT
jgi:hypothetical protein